MWNTTSEFHKLNCGYLGADYMGIFSPGWTFSPVDRAESSSQASYKILVKRSLRFQPGLPGWNFSPVWATRDEIFNKICCWECLLFLRNYFPCGNPFNLCCKHNISFLSWNNKMKYSRICLFFPNSYQHAVSSSYTRGAEFFKVQVSADFKREPGSWKVVEKSSG